MEGDHKHVTVLLAELKGSMELLADGDPVLRPMLEALGHTDATA